MNAQTASLYRLSGEALALCVHSSPKHEVHLTAEGFLVLRGEPTFGPNVAMVTGGIAVVERLREFDRRALQSDLPCSLWLPTEQPDRLSAVARELKFTQVGT